MFNRNKLYYRKLKTAPLVHVNAKVMSGLKVAQVSRYRQNINIFTFDSHFRYNIVCIKKIEPFCKPFSIKSNLTSDVLNKCKCV